MSRGGEFGEKIHARNWRWGSEEGEAALAGGLLQSWGWELGG